ncbi:LuxR C-terminal-related transcriptional regulator [Leucobacter sp. GX24907]
MELGKYHHDLLCRIADVVSAPRDRLAEELSSLLASVLEHRTLALLAADASGGWTSWYGERRFPDELSRLELDRLRREAPEAQTVTRKVLNTGGHRRAVLQAVSRNGALLVLADPGPADADALVLDIWNIVAVQVQSRADEASAAYLHDARVSAGERLSALTALADEYSTTLESVLAVLRSSHVDDRAARRQAEALATEGLVELRAAGDRVRTLSEEPVATAFVRLQHELRPVMRHRDIAVQFVEPPLDGRPLPGEVARGARAAVRGVILAIADLAGVTRVRVQWDCDGTHLLINIRDDGPGREQDAAALEQSVQQRMHALAAELSVEHTAGWGTEMSMAIPLDPPRTLVAASVTGDLRPREVEVLQLLVAGYRNRAIASELNISENTVKFHVSRILHALGVGSRAEAIAAVHAERA